MRKALVVGIDHYSKINRLFGCVNDAHAVKNVLERNSDGTVNFGVKFLVASDDRSKVLRASLRESVQELFSEANEIALLYFAGHGHVDAAGGYLCSSDTETGDDGLSLREVLSFANKSKAKNRVIVLDSCHSGSAGEHSLTPQSSELTEGLTILTASTTEQYASEENGSGVFTTLFVNALSGAAGNLVGDVTPGSVYAHIDQSLGPWDQRPVFKTNVKSFVSLRKVQPPISIADLHKLTELFPTPGFDFRLDPTFEPKSPSPDKKNTETFAILQKLNRVNLVVPVGAIHMYFAAMENKSCRLTVLGEHYRRLVERNRI